MSSFSPTPDPARRFEPRPIAESAIYESTPAEAGVLARREAQAGPADEGPPAEPHDAAAERERAYREGYEAGRAEPTPEASAAWQRFGVALAETLCQLDALRREYLIAQRDAVVELTLAIAEHLVGDALRTEPAALARWVEKALTPFAQADAVRVALAPGDRARLEQFEGRPSAVEWYEDPQLESGEVRVECGASCVEARLAAYLEELRVALRGNLALSAPAEPAPAEESPV